MGFLLGPAQCHNDMVEIIGSLNLIHNPVDGSCVLDFGMKRRKEKSHPRMPGVVAESSFEARDIGFSIHSFIKGMERRKNSVLLEIWHDSTTFLEVMLPLMQRTISKHAGNVPA
jgi:hypothetical protein